MNGHHRFQICSGRYPFFNEKNNVPSIIVKDYFLESSQGVCGDGIKTL